MKKTLLFITLFITGVCFAQKYEGMEFYDNGEPKYIKTYKESKGKLELVKLVSWHRNGQKEAEGTFKDGKLDGKHTSWYENGQKLLKGTFKDGKEDGLWTYYTEVGNGKYEVTFKAGIYTTAVFTDSLGIDYTGMPITDEPEQDGIILFQDDEGGEYDFSKFPKVFATVKDGKPKGLIIEWYENGQKESEVTFKDGEQDGLWTEWRENGQKKEEKTYKDGELDGLLTYWYENGQKKQEQIYKEGELTSEKYWDEDGNEI